MRPKPLLLLLKSVEVQTAYPDQIIIVDGSINSVTEVTLNEHSFSNLEYYKVTEQDWGLIKQRNFGGSSMGSCL